MTKERLSNFELLRIIAMLFIVMNHFNTHGIFKYSTFNNTLLLKINNLISATGSLGGKLGVMLFVLISGYFLIDSQFKISRVVKVYLKTWLYAVLIFILTIFVFHFAITSDIIKYSFMPVGFRGYWFIKVYIILLLFSPFINIFFNALSKQQLKYFLIFTTAIWFLPMIWGGDYCFSELAAFVYLYILGGTIKREQFNLFKNKKLIYLLGITAFLIVVIHNIFVISEESVRLAKATRYIKLDSILTLTIATAIFTYFKNLNIRYNKFINYISASVFAVYLIHDNKIIRPFLWTKWLNVGQFITSPYFVLYWIGICVLIFMVCVCTDKVFDLIFKKPINYLAEKADNVFNKLG